MTCDAILILGFLIGLLGGVLMATLNDNIDRIQRERKPAKFDPPI
jgi:LPS O-antigen subunit length determinant protein (WzzB/FepE family)